MNLEVGGDLVFEGLQELLELDRAMPAVQRPDYLAAREVQRCIQA